MPRWGIFKRFYKRSRVGTDTKVPSNVCGSDGPKGEEVAMLEALAVESKMRKLAERLRAKAQELASQESSKPASSALRAVIYQEIAALIEEEFKSWW